MNNEEAIYYCQEQLLKVEFFSTKVIVTDIYTGYATWGNTFLEAVTEMKKGLEGD